MQNLNLFDVNNFDEYDLNEMIDTDSSLVNETTIGWSSACLDQTIHYYIDCNINIAQNKE